MQGEIDENAACVYCVHVSGGTNKLKQPATQGAQNQEIVKYWQQKESNKKVFSCNVFIPLMFLAGIAFLFCFSFGLCL